MPYLIAIGGHTGTGKTTLAFRLRDAVEGLRGALVMDGDQARREMLGYALRDVMKPDDYAPEVTDRLRDRMDETLRQALAKGQQVIDCSGFFTQGERRRIEALAAACGVPFIGLWLTAEREAMSRRILKRLAERRDNPESLCVEAGHASDACLGVIDKFGDIGVPESKAWTILDSSGPVEEVLGQALERIRVR